MSEKPLSLSAKIFLSLAGLILLFSSFMTTQYLARLTAFRKQHPFSFSGNKFHSMKAIILNQKYVGYISDKDFRNDLNNAEFEQAQFILAPVILELNNPHHRFLIINCDDQRHTQAALKNYNARSIRAVDQNVILAVREGL